MHEAILPQRASEKRNSPGPTMPSDSTSSTTKWPPGSNYYRGRNSSAVIEIDEFVVSAIGADRRLRFEIERMLFRSSSETGYFSRWMSATRAILDSQISKTTF